MAENDQEHNRMRASPYFWQEMLNDLHFIGPKGWLSWAPLCRNLMDLWWPRRYDSQAAVTYLPLAILHEMSTAICHQGEDSHGPKAFSQGPFFSQYSSVIPFLKRKRVGFVLSRNVASMGALAPVFRTQQVEQANHFFPVVFDYDTKFAYSFGAFCDTKRPATETLVATESSWERWLGPQLWTHVAFSLGWQDHLCPLTEVNVVSKEWKQVCCLPLLPLNRFLS